MRNVEDRPKAPAQAYHVMAQILGPGYFLRPPASEGREIVVIGTDGVATEWVVPAEHMTRILWEANSDRRVYSARRK